MIRTLRRRFIAVTLSALSALLLALAGCIIAAGYFQMENSADVMLHMLAEGGSPPPPPGGPRNPAFGYQISSDPMPMRYLVAILDGEGQIFPVHQAGIAEDERSALEDYCRQIKAQGGRDGKIGAYKYLTVDKGGGRLLIAFLDNSIQAQMLSRMLVMSLWVIFFSMLLMLLFVLPVSSWAARSYAANVEKQRQFITNAGHEIKTPVAIIQSNIDAMELIQGKNKWTRNIRGQTERLGRLIKQLLLLSRMEEDLSQSFETVDLSALIQSEITPYAEAVGFKSLSLLLDIEKRLSVNGNPDALRQLVHILMDNAVAYTQQGGEIAVRFLSKGKKAHLSVRNSTDALPAVPPNVLFERFYRADPARTDDGGYGIGLSAARLIVETHRGRMDASYEGDRHVIFDVVLPMGKRAGVDS